MTDDVLAYSASTSLGITTPVALVQMPFATTAWPSLALGLLKAELAERGVSSHVRYLNFLLEELIGSEHYTRISRGEPQSADLLGEWIFSAAARGVAPAIDDPYLDRVMFGADRHHRKSADHAALQVMRAAADGAVAHVERFLDRCMALDWSGYRIVGFTSVFQQHTPSLALARRLKARHPDLHIVIGGANCEGDMGRATLEAFDFVDAVCTGEGDIAFPDHVEAVLAGRPRTISGMLTRNDAAGRSPPPAARQATMDALPYPDYDEFFTQRDAIGDAVDARATRILFESSRGCWWGQKNHCTFCGLNGQGINFRHKSSDRALAELQHLVGRYGDRTQRVSATDNIIPHSYFRDFLPALAELGLDLDIFYETKANLTKDQLSLYKAAGLNAIQPGIESLQTDVLMLMRKGVSALQNIRLLKWCAELNIVPHWNYLCGFPGEAAASYHRAATVVPRLRHLMPPSAMARLRYDRFSPFVTTPDAFGIRNMRPYPAYRSVYPDLPDALVDRLAYFFVAEFDGDEAIPLYTASLETAITDWIAARDRGFLVHFAPGGDAATVIVDGRSDGDPDAYELSPGHAAVLELCDGIASGGRIADRLADRLTPAEVDGVLGDLCDIGAIIEEDGDFLSLSVPLLSACQISPDGMERLRSSLGRTGGAMVN